LCDMMIPDLQMRLSTACTINDFSAMKDASWKLLKLMVIDEEEEMEADQVGGMEAEMEVEMEAEIE